MLAQAAGVRGARDLPHLHAVAALALVQRETERLLGDAAGGDQEHRARRDPGIIPTSERDGFMPETARSDCRRARQRPVGGVASVTSFASIGRAAPSETTAARRRSRDAASSRTSPPSDRPKPAILPGSTSGRRAR